MMKFMKGRYNVGASICHTFVEENEIEKKKLNTLM